MGKTCPLPGRAQVRLLPRRGDSPAEGRHPECRADAEDISLAKAALKTIREGDIFDGIVTTVASFGVFVEIKVKKAKRERKEFKV